MKVFSKKEIFHNRFQVMTKKINECYVLSKKNISK